MRSQRSDILLMLIAMIPLAAGAFAWISWQQAGAPYLPLPVTTLPDLPQQHQLESLAQSIEQWVPPGMNQPLGVPGLLTVILIAGVICAVAALILLDVLARARRALLTMLKTPPPVRVVSGIFRHDPKPIFGSYADEDDDD